MPERAPQDAHFILSWVHGLAEVLFQPLAQVVRRLRSWAGNRDEAGVNALQVAGAEVAAIHARITCGKKNHQAEGATKGPGVFTDERHDALCVLNLANPLRTS